MLTRLGSQMGSHLTGEVGIALEVRDKKGRTDLEINVGDALVICEAKRDWLLLSTSQLPVRRTWGSLWQRSLGHPVAGIARSGREVTA